MASILSMVTTDRPVTKLPVHTLLVEGKLDNGFSYVILPNSVPAGRFEAHLEVLSGSAHELDQQQGIIMFYNRLHFRETPFSFISVSVTAVVRIMIDVFVFSLHGLSNGLLLHLRFTDMFDSQIVLGMAHLLEHVAYMGSLKRQLISGTGSRTNAYTDFHHTVFFAACPTQTPDEFWYVHFFCISRSSFSMHVLLLRNHALSNVNSNEYV
jgi:Insulinase (Peptidase family M16)